MFVFVNIYSDAGQGATCSDTRKAPDYRNRVKNACTIYAALAQLSYGERVSRCKGKGAVG